MIDTELSKICKTGHAKVFLKISDQKYGSLLIFLVNLSRDLVILLKTGHRGAWVAPCVKASVR